MFLIKQYMLSLKEKNVCVVWVWVCVFGATLYWYKEIPLL